MHRHTDIAPVQAHMRLHFLHGPATEYVALERLESAYGNCPFVLPNGVCCVADPDKSFVVALILVSRNAVTRAAAAAGWAGDFRPGAAEADTEVSATL